MELTLENILFELRKEGVLNKNNLLKKLDNASFDDLLTLKYSIQKKINLMMLEESRKK